MTSSSARSTLSRLLEVTSGRLPKLSSYDFYTAWKKYDINGSGYIEEQELPYFLREYLTSLGGLSTPSALTTKGLHELAQTFLSQHDRNRDGRISLEELSTLLPTDQAFLMVFRERNPFVSASTFMQAWRKYDRDLSGCIDNKELQNFMTDIYAGQNLGSAQLKNYSESLLEIFDANHDSQLSLPEVAQLLPPQENFLYNALRKTGLTSTAADQVNDIFRKFDKNNDGYMSKSEVEDFSRELIRAYNSRAVSDADAESSVRALAEAILISSDTNRDGRISQKELQTVLNAITKS